MAFTLLYCVVFYASTDRLPFSRVVTDEKPPRKSKFHSRERKHFYYLSPRNRVVAANHGIFFFFFFLYGRALYNKKKRRGGCHTICKQEIKRKNKRCFDAIAVFRIIEAKK